MTIEPQYWVIGLHSFKWSSDLTLKKKKKKYVCFSPTDGDKDVQFKDSSFWGHRRAITASTVLPLLSLAADRRRSCIDKLPWMNALKRSCTQPGVKITFPLMTNLKQGTLDKCKSMAGRGLCAADQELGGLFFLLADVYFFHSACLPVQLLLQVFWPVVTKPK